jgi:DNA-binding transcriptional LysR family regulator
MLDVTRLRVLAAVARHGSVTAAAKALNYAQPSVSHHLARLEAETGTRLIERFGRGVRLTDAGRLLAGRAEEILGRLAAAEHELAAHVGQREERIRIAGFPSVLATMVPVAAARLRADHPGVELLLAEAEPQGAVRMLRAGRVDMALVFAYLQQDTAGAQPAAAGQESGVVPQARAGQQAGAAQQSVAGGFTDEDDGVRARLLLDEPVHLVTQAGAAVPARTAGSRLASYAEHRWIAGCERCRAHLLWQCERAGFTPQIAFTTDDVLVAQALAAAGLGIALLPDLALRAARHPGVRTEPLPGARRQVLALTYGDPPGPPAAERLLDALAEAAEGKTGEGKAGVGKTAEGKTAEGKTGEGKTGEGKTAEGKTAEGKTAEGKTAEGKTAEGKTGEGKTAEGKTAEGRAAEGRTAEGRTAEGRTAEGRTAEARTAEGRTAEARTAP